MPFQVSVGRFYVAHWDNLVSVCAKPNMETNVERVSLSTSATAHLDVLTSHTHQWIAGLQYIALMTDRCKPT